MAIRIWLSDTYKVLDRTGMSIEMIFYLRMTFIPDLNRDGYVTGIFFHPRVTRRVPDTLLSV
jgi:hypothetical protein